tara:strand:+ start:697 stop:888 length:192 start_codon:yes stop_codon:yes gene_type:complete
MSSDGIVDASMVPNNNPRIGIINEIEKSEKITDKKLNKELKIIFEKYGFINFKILKTFFILQI